MSVGGCTDYIFFTFDCISDKSHMFHMLILYKLLWKCKADSLGSSMTEDHLSYKKIMESKISEISMIAKWYTETREYYCSWEPYCYIITVLFEICAVTLDEHRKVWKSIKSRPCQITKKAVFHECILTCWCYLKQNCIKIQKRLQCNADKFIIIYVVTCYYNKSIVNYLYI